MYYGIPAATATSKTFHAGTAIANDQIVTAGGRVLCCTALGDTVTEAQKNAYELVAAIQGKTPTSALISPIARFAANRNKLQKQQWLPREPLF